MPPVEFTGPIAHRNAAGPRAGGPVKFHLSLNVRNLERSISFYRALFDREPAKQFPDYAKFELIDPPLVLSLEPQPHAPGGSLNHLGFRVPSAQALVEMQRRLESSSLATTREDGIECCHSTQTKFWIADPDGNNWEIYLLEADIDHPPKTPSSPTPATAPASIIPAAIWEHVLGTPFPQSIPLADGSADQVLLRGTFNQPLSADDVTRILAEARRVLRPGGTVAIHVLVSNLPLIGDAPMLPGPAAAVKFIPTESAPLDALHAAGFTAIHIVRFSQSPVFTHNAAALRELLVEARNHQPSPFAIQQTAIYRGPSPQITDDQGNVFHRGRRTAITSDIAELLRTGPLAASFIFLTPGEDDR